MYGMIPSAKIVAFCRFPPANKSYNPRIVPRWRWKNSLRTDASTPGVVI